MSDQTTPTQGAQPAAPTTTTPAQAERPAPKSFRDISAGELEPSRLPDRKVEAAPQPEPEDEDDDFEDEDDDTDDSGDESDNGKDRGRESELDSDSEDDEEDDDSDSEDEEKGVDSEDEDAPFLKCKVDGKMRSFTKAQVTSMIASGAHRQEAWAKKETEFNENMGRLKQEAKKIDYAGKKLAPVWEALEKKDIEGALLEFAGIKGMSRLQIRRDLREQFMGIITKRLGISQEWVQNRLKEIAPQIQTWDTQEENEFLEAQLKEKASQATTQEPTEVETAKKAIREFQYKFGVSQDELGEAVKFATDEICGGDKNKLTIDMVQKVVFDNRVVKRVFNAIRARKPSLAKDEKFVDKVIAKAKKHPEWEVADLARYVGVLSRKIAERKQADSEKQLATDLSKKVLSARPKSSFKSPSEGKKRLSFREFDHVLP